VKRRLVVSAGVDRDLDETLEYLGQSDRRVADRFLTAVHRVFADILESPGIGARREFQAARLHEIRSWRIKGFEKWLVFYRVTDEAVEILRVLHGARDLGEAFDEDAVGG